MGNNSISGFDEMAHHILQLYFLVAAEAGTHRSTPFGRNGRLHTGRLII